MNRPLPTLRDTHFPRLLSLLAAIALSTPAFGQGAASTADAPAQPPRVRQWDRFEAEVSNARAYQDPYRDVALDVVFTSPFGEQVAFWGFYDGDGTWRIRFMPGQRGTWRYEAAFSDGTPGARGSFVCTASDLPGMVRVNRANPIWFSGDVGPVLIRGLHVGDRFFAENWPVQKRNAFLDWANGQGYNLLSVASHYLNRNADGRGRGWETPKLWPLDASEYRKMEGILDDLARRRIYVYPFAGVFGQRSNYPRDAEDQERYIRYTLARLGSYWNVLLNVAGPEPNLRNRWMADEDVVRLGRLIGKLDPFGHPLSVHNRTGDDPYRDSDWTTYGTLQGPKTVSRQTLSRGLLASQHPAKPLLAQETLWSDNVNHPRYTDADLRKNAYVINLSGASLVFGDMHGDSSSGFSGSMELSERDQKRHDIIKAVWDYIESVPYFEMQPRQDLVSNGFCLAQPGRQYLVYLEKPGSVDVSIDGGPYAVSWINAATVSDRRSGGLTSNGQGLNTPDGGDDWLLHLTRTGGGLPSQIHLSWVENPSESLAVTWHTAAQDNPATVEFRSAGAGSWQKAAGSSHRSPGQGWLHRVTLNGLTPDTAYEYRVSSDRGLSAAASQSYTTKTAPPPGPSDFSFAFICDTGLIGRIDGNATGTRQVIDALLGHRPLFILGGGDYAYANRDERFRTVGAAVDEWFVQWQEVLARIPFMAQYGNHEAHLKEQFSDWAPRFAHPPGHGEGQNYSFRVGEVHFTALYVPSPRLPDEQLDWLESDLAAARERGARWLVVYQHEPIFGHGRSHPAVPAVRNKLAPILEKHRVDLHLSCHDQNYERTFPVSGVPSGMKIGSTSLDRYAQGEGVIYAKISPSGKQSEIGDQFSRFTTAQQPFIAKRETGFHHYGLLHVSATGELKVEVYRLAGDGSPPELFDSFVISK